MAPSIAPKVLGIRERMALMHRLLRDRLETVLPAAMRETGFDMWLVVCQEDDYDPVFRTLVPPDSWCPILQMLVFYDPGTGPVERINLSMSNFGDLYDKPWSGHREEEQWALLGRIIEERKPRRIGINTGRTQWAAGGLTHNLYTRLCAALPDEYLARLACAEPLVIRWAATLTDQEIRLYKDVVHLARWLIASCYTREVIKVGETTTEDLEWHYWQTASDLGLELAFRPFFSLWRSRAERERYGADDRVIRPGDLLHCDVGIKYLGLNSDHQQVAYVLRPGEEDAPEGLKALLHEANRLQDIYMAQFRAGLTGNELLVTILNAARAEGIPNPRVYSHSLGHFLHEPGPLIGLPWEQGNCGERGDVALKSNYAFTMELSVTGAVPECGGEEVTLGVEEDVVFTNDRCLLIDGRQTRFYLI